MIAIEPLNEQGRARHRCECGHVTAPILPGSAGKVQCRCRRPAVPAPPGLAERLAKFTNDTHRRKRPGTELKLLLQELGITNFTGCGCGSNVAKMNAWGVDGCREHFDTIRGWIVDAQAKANWSTKITAAARATTTGIAMQIDLADVAGSLVRIAIERAS